MRFARWFPCLVLCLAALSVGAQPAALPPPKEDPGNELARLIHKSMAAKMPRVFEDKSGWGRTIPLPERVRRPGLRRVIIDVDGRPEVPDGNWHKVRVRVEDPERDLHVQVLGLKSLDATSYRLTMETDADLEADAVLKRWKNGVLLSDIGAQSHVSVTVFVDMTLNAKLSTSGVQLEPEVKDVKMTLNELLPERVIFRRAGVVIEGEPVARMGQEFRGVLQGMLKKKEPEFKKRIQEAVTRALKEERGLAASAAMMKAAGPLLKADRPKDK
jgi:hypothetical protein